MHKLYRIGYHIARATVRYFLNATITKVLAARLLVFFKLEHYPNTEMDVIVKHINSGVVEFNHDCVINFSDVEDAVRGLKPAKHDGYAGLSTDYFINMDVMSCTYILHFCSQL